ncbi:DEKNAAC103331 [Brettanomyces naardenensis]|uniref:DEKNAAC103331 n=1 Tax=Brettanomyces naardenensis TaxID=13370 RepID=A0A448YNS1_BRENA|nr:DEKNAAC103331 [Brettanomyces naardenensis]
MNSAESSNFVKYHKALQLYLGISQDALTPVTSSRVAKAREKLSRLTEIQFYDLSTDVYDELQRRINETNEKPKHLPPQSTYHPKRNQARQKLAALPSQRFKDLVNDVLYEIDKRHLTAGGVQQEQQQQQQQQQQKKDIGSPNLNQYPPAEAQQDYLPNQRSPKKPDLEVRTAIPQQSPERPDSERSELEIPRLEKLPLEIETPSQREIKASKVVPQRAELTWSSDDEDEDVANALKAVKSKPEGEVSNVPVSSPAPQIRVVSDEEFAAIKKRDDEIAVKDSQISSLQKQVSTLQKELEEQTAENHRNSNTIRETSVKNEELGSVLEKTKEENTRLLQTNEESRDRIDELQSQLDVLRSAPSDRSIVSSDEYTSLQKQYNELSQEKYMSTQLTKRLQDELSQLTVSNDSLKQENANLRDTTEKSYRGLQEEHDKLQKQYKSLQRDHATLKNTLDLPSKKVTSSSSSQDSDWKRKFEKLRSGEVVESILSKDTPDLKDLQRYCDVDGSVPLETVADFYASVEGLLSYVSGPVETEGLFHGVSEIVTAAGAIIKEAGSNDPTSKVGEKTQLIKSSLSNLLTSARYYALYKDVIPKLLIHASINDVYFALCDLVSLTKIHATGDSLIKAVQNYGSKVRKSLQTKNTNGHHSNHSGAGDIPSLEASPIERAYKSLSTQSDELRLSMPTSNALNEFDEPPRTPTFDEAGVRPLRMAQKLSASQESLNNASIDEKVPVPHNFGNTMSPISAIQVTRPDASPYANGNGRAIIKDTEVPDVVQPKKQSLPSNEPPKEAVKRDAPFKKDDSRGSPAFNTANVSVSSLASRFSESPSSSPRSLNSGNGYESARSTPKKENQLLSKLKKQFEEPEKGQQTKITNETFPGGGSPSPIKLHSNSEDVAKAFDKFGAKRRSTDSLKASVDKVVESEQNGKFVEIPPAVEKKEKEREIPVLKQPSVAGEEAVDGLLSPIHSSGDFPSAGSALNPLPKRIKPSTAELEPEPEEEEEEEDFDFENFNTLDPDNTLKELLLYLEHQTVEVIAAIQQLLKSIRDPKATRGLLRKAADQIIMVVKQMCEGTRTLMNQSRYADAMGHARYVVDVLQDCVTRMSKLYGTDLSKDMEYADKDFKQRSAGIAFDIARSTKELVKTVEEASLRDEIAVIDSRLNVPQPV